MRRGETEESDKRRVVASVSRLDRMIKEGLIKVNKNAVKSSQKEKLRKA